MLPQGGLPQTSSGHSFSLSGGAIGVDTSVGFSLTPVAGGVVLFDFVSGFSTTMCAKVRNTYQHRY